MYIYILLKKVSKFNGGTCLQYHINRFALYTDRVMSYSQNYLKSLTKFVKTQKRMVKYIIKVKLSMIHPSKSYK